MHRDLLAHFPVVLTVAKRRSFAAAAAELGMGPSAVSHAVRTVEERLGATIFSRTTRSVALTEAGQELVDAIAPAFLEIEEAMERVGSNQGHVSGLLRLNVPRLAMPMALTSILAQLAWRHPALTVEVVSDEALTDIVAGGFDAGIRLGEMMDQDMIAVRLTPPFNSIMVASSEYVASKGMPERIEDLQSHNCIGYRQLSAGGLYAWDLMIDGAPTTCRVQGSAIVSDSLHARDLAMAGVGIAYLFEPLVRSELRDQKLVWVLPASAFQEPGLFIYFPKRASMAPKLRAFLDVAKEVGKGKI